MPVAAPAPISTEHLLNDWLHQCQRTLGPVPRQLSWFDRLCYLSIRAPAWAKKDQLQVFFKNQELLLRQGDVVWGNIIQANTSLFVPGHLGYPADVVYAANKDQDFDPEILKSIASKIYGLKGTEPTEPDLKKVADHMTDEYERIFGLFVPSSFAWNIPCEISTIFIARQHLPNGYLSRTLVPLMVNPEQPKIAMILPSKYWPAAMLDWWVG